MTPASTRGSTRGSPVHVRPRVVILTGLAISGLVLSYALLSSDGWREKSRLQREESALDGRVKRLKSENAALAKEAKALRDERADNPVLEEAVRSELGYVKKNEVVVLTADDGADEHATISTTKEKE